MAEHRVSMLRSSLRRRTDPARSRDPRVRAVLAQLAELEVAPGPDPQFRTDLRAQLVAIAPRIVAESSTAEVERPGQRTAGVESKASARTPAKHAENRGRRFPVARSLRIATATLAVCALLLGGAVWMSRKALPGDALYGLKRTGERVELSFAGNDRDRAQDRLDFAHTRVDEVYQLWTQATSHALARGANADAGVSSRTSSLITDTLAAADSDLSSATQLLTGEAVSSRSADPLRTLTSWAPQQIKLLSAIADAMPPSTLRGHALSSGDLVRAAVLRAGQLGTDVNCPALHNAPTDKLGPIPAASCATPRPKIPSTGGTKPGSGSGSGSGSGTGPGNGSGSAPGGTTRSTTSGQQHTTAAPKHSGAKASATGAAKSINPPAVPQLPVRAPKPSVGSCVSVSAGPVQVGLGKCSSSS